MSYLVLARKWRPMTFSDLVGQEHVSKTLSNAINSGRIAHAFLLTGVRGVGKTTSARILAKSLNCEHGPSPEPCLKCPACLEITASNDIDVQEIDGASYNGVDEVRRLQESLPYRPSRDRFKIVIVDEVHMLTPSAWNAFLKTLEEPPPHVKFIFATTEVHRVPVTILSRCQRYDFKLIGSAAIGARLRYVLGQEQIEADDAAISLISREAAGSMRDAMSLLDQAIAWGGTKLVGDEISRVLGLAGHGALHQLATVMVQGDAAGCLEAVASLADQGFDILQIARDVLAHLRDLVVVKTCPNPTSMVDLTNDEVQLVRQLVETTTAEDLLRLHLGFSKGFDQVAHAPQPRAALEMLLVRLALRPPLQPVDDLLTRLGDMERRLVGKGAKAPSPARPRAQGSSPAQGTTLTSVMGGRLDSDPHYQVAVAGSSALALSPVEAFQPQTSVMSEEGFGDEAESSEESEALETQPTHAEELRTWARILEGVREQNTPFASVLEHVVPLELTAQNVVIGVEEGSFIEMQVRDEAAMELLTRTVRAFFQGPTKVSLTLQHGPSAKGSTLSDKLEAERQERVRQVRAALENHKLVQIAVKELGARITQIKLPD